MLEWTIYLLMHGMNTMQVRLSARLDTNKHRHHIVETYSEVVCGWVKQEAILSGLLIPSTKISKTSSFAQCCAQEAKYHHLQMNAI